MTTSRASDVCEGEMDRLQVSFGNDFVVFFLVAFICYLLIPLLLNRFNVVAVNGRDEIEMWCRASFSTRATQPSDWNSKRLS